MAPVDKDAFGNGLGTEAHRINAVLSATPQTVEVIARKARIEREKRVYDHLYLYLLGKRGYVIHEPKGKDGKWALNSLGLAKWRNS